tara:strand:- start:354 stop:632 length:279 start_codon:yes stop_codon:yes gene_type:complete
MGVFSVTTQIAARRYSLEELDALRECIREKHTSYAYPFICPMDSEGNYLRINTSPSREVVEDYLRTDMMAGISASDYETESASLLRVGLVAD